MLKNTKKKEERKRRIQISARGRKNGKQKTILMGVYNNKILTADVELRDWNGYPEFSACFNIGEAFNVDDVDKNYLEDYFLEVWDSCYDAAGKLDLLDDGEKQKRSY